MSKSKRKSGKRRATFYVALAKNGTPKGAFMNKHTALAAHKRHGEYDVFTCRVSNYQDNHELYCIAHTYWNERYNFEDDVIKVFVRRVDMVKYMKKIGLLKDGLLEDWRVFLYENKSESIEFDAVPDSYLRRKSLVFGTSLDEIRIIKVNK